MSNKVSDFFSRVEYIVDTYYKGNKSAFSRETGISRQYLNKMSRQARGELSGDPNPSLEVLQKIVTNTGVSPLWLLTGKGAPEDPVGPLAAREAAHNDALSGLRKSDISADEKVEFVSGQLERLLRILRNLE